MGRVNTLWNSRLILLRKLFAAGLSVSFVLAPVGSVFAQEAGSGTLVTVDAASSTPLPIVTPPSDQTPTLSIPGVPPEPTPAGAASPSSDSGSNAPTANTASTLTDASAPSGTATQPPTNTTSQNSLSSPTTAFSASFGPSDAPTDPNPNVFSLNAIPRVDGQSGALTQSLKLDIPPGRNGLQPDLALQYNNQRTEDSIVGYGWTITIPYIQRLNKTGSQNLYNAAYFKS